MDVARKKLPDDKQLIRVGNYAITGKVLGKGHFAKVVEAYHTLVRVKVAIKIININDITDTYVKKNLKREAKIMSKISHPNVIFLFETIQTTNHYYIITELGTGGDLCNFVKSQRHGKLEEIRARPLARQLVSAVGHLHERGIVHRDLKMENILLDNTKEKIKIVDFGLSNFCKFNDLLKTHCGSPEYAAPELYIRGRKYGPEVDIWSLGIILYGMVTGKLPFQTWHKVGLNSHEKRKHLMNETKNGLTAKHHKHMTDLSYLRNVITRMLNPESTERISMHELKLHSWIYSTENIHEFPADERTWRKNVINKISEYFKYEFTETYHNLLELPYGPLGGIYNIEKYSYLNGRLQEINAMKLQNKVAQNLNSAQNIPIKDKKSTSQSPETFSVPQMTNFDWNKRYELNSPELLSALTVNTTPTTTTTSSYHNQNVENEGKEEHENEEDTNHLNIDNNQIITNNPMIRSGGGADSTTTANATSVPVIIKKQQLTKLVASTLPYKKVSSDVKNVGAVTNFLKLPKNTSQEQPNLHNTETTLHYQQQQQHQHQQYNNHSSKGREPKIIISKTPIIMPILPPPRFTANHQISQPILPRQNSKFKSLTVKKSPKMISKSNTSSEKTTTSKMMKYINVKLSQALGLYTTNVTATLATNNIRDQNQNSKIPIATLPPELPPTTTTTNTKIRPKRSSLLRSSLSQKSKKSNNNNNIKSTPTTNFIQNKSQKKLQFIPLQYQHHQNQQQQQQQQQPQQQQQQLQQQQQQQQQHHLQQNKRIKLIKKKNMKNRDNRFNFVQSPVNYTNMMQHSFPITTIPQQHNTDHNAATTNYISKPKLNLQKKIHHNTTIIHDNKNTNDTRFYNNNKHEKLLNNYNNNNSGGNDGGNDGGRNFIINAEQCGRQQQHNLNNHKNHNKINKSHSKATPTNTTIGTTATATTIGGGYITSSHHYYQHHHNHYHHDQNLDSSLDTMKRQKIRYSNISAATATTTNPSSTTTYNPNKFSKNFHINSNNIRSKNTG